MVVMVLFTEVEARYSRSGDYPAANELPCKNKQNQTSAHPGSNVDRHEVEPSEDCRLASTTAFDLCIASWMLAVVSSASAEEPPCGALGKLLSKMVYIGGNRRCWCWRC